MSGLHWLDSDHTIYAARVYGVRGPRGGRPVLWGVYQGARLLATESTLKACRESWRAHCTMMRVADLDAAPVCDETRRTIDETRRLYPAAPEMVPAREAESALSRDGATALDTGNNFHFDSNGRVSSRIGAGFYHMFTTRHDAPIAAIQRRLLEFWR